MATGAMLVVKNLLREYIKTAYQADPTLRPGDWHDCEDLFVQLARFVQSNDSGKLTHSVAITTGTGTMTIVISLDPTPNLTINGVGAVAWAKAQPNLPGPLQ